MRTFRVAHSYTVVPSNKLDTPLTSYPVSTQEQYSVRRGICQRWQMTTSQTGLSMLWYQRAQLEGDVIIPGAARYTERQI